MKTRILLSALFLLILSACVKENITENHDKETQQVTITGNSMYSFANQTSRATTVSQIPEDGEILFYSTGGVNADGDILSYKNGTWVGLENDKWNTSGENANIAAYYPVINSPNDLYYDNGELKDIVWCKSAAEIGKSISLSFSHMFAKLVINIENELNEIINDIKINIPYKINYLDFYTGNYSFAENENANISITPKKYSGKYEILVPASNNAIISLEISCSNGKTYTPTIDNTIYNAGHEYICNIKVGNKGKGIYTKEDFIAFTYLINGVEYESRSLDEFYIEQDGKRIFNLFNDLNFTDEEAAKIKRIGEGKKTFDDVFNGNNHVLENIIINTTVKKSTLMGLFDRIENQAIVKNLTLLNCRITEDNDDYLSPLAGCNYGIIDNCHVINCIISLLSDRNFSAFVTMNSGTIVNCSLSGITLEKALGTIGIFNYQNNGDIINCRINNDINAYSKGASSSVISSNNYGNLYNIFVEKYINKYYGISYENKEKGNFFNCAIPERYNEGDKIYVIGKDYNTSSQTKGIIFYSDSQDEYTNITNSLNNWIENEGKILYPDITFRNWKTDSTEKVVFD